MKSGIGENDVEIDGNRRALNKLKAKLEKKNLKNTRKGWNHKEPGA